MSLVRDNAAELRRLIEEVVRTPGTVIPNSIVGLPFKGAEASYGASTVTWPGGSQSSNTLTVSHGLNGTPTVVLVTPSLGSDFSVSFPIYGARDDDSFDVFLRTPSGTPANTVTTAINWLAVRSG